MEKLSYDVAYSVLPRYAFHDLGKVTSLVLAAPSAAGPFFYAMVCAFHHTELVPEDAKRFRWHHGQLDASRQFYLLEFPRPHAVDFSELPMDELATGSHVLAPYFVAIVCDAAYHHVQYYILGQAPLGGGTTVRSMTADGVNANHGPGPAPDMAAFLDVIRAR